MLPPHYFYFPPMTYAISWRSYLWQFIPKQFILSSSFILTTPTPLTTWSLVAHPLDFIHLYLADLSLTATWSIIDPRSLKNDFLFKNFPFTTLQVYILPSTISPFTVICCSSDTSFPLCCHYLLVRRTITDSFSTANLSMIRSYNSTHFDIFWTAGAWRLLKRRIPFHKPCNNFQTANTWNLLKMDLLSESLHFLLDWKYLDLSEVELTKSL